MVLVIDVDIKMLTVLTECDAVISHALFAFFSARTVITSYFVQYVMHTYHNHQQYQNCEKSENVFHN